MVQATQEGAWTQFRHPAVPEDREKAFGSQLPRTVPRARPGWDQGVVGAEAGGKRPLPPADRRPPPRAAVCGPWGPLAAALGREPEPRPPGTPQRASLPPRPRAPAAPRSAPQAPRPLPQSRIPPCPAPGEPGQDACRPLSGGGRCSPCLGPTWAAGGGRRALCLRSGRGPSLLWAQLCKAPRRLLHSATTPQ